MENATLGLYSRNFPATKEMIIYKQPKAYIRCKTLQTPLKQNKQTQTMWKEKHQPKTTNQRENRTKPVPQNQTDFHWKLLSKSQLHFAKKKNLAPLCTPKKNVWRKNRLWPWKKNAGPSRKFCPWSLHATGASPQIRPWEFAKRLGSRSGMVEVGSW